MKILKPNFVVPVASVEVKEKFSFKMQNKNSPFSNGYDIERAAKSLGNKVQSNNLSESDSDFAKWKTFKAHEKLLRQHIEEQTGRKLTLQWGEYDISSTQNERFNKIGMLSNTNADFVQIHTKQGVRMWDGNNDKSTGKRWAGIRYALRLSNELTSFAVKDNPFAQAALLRLEDDLIEVENYFSEMQTSIVNQLEDLSQSGINITIVGNPEPVLISLNAVRGYGFRLLKVLTDYDLFVRSIKTLTMKGLMNNSSGNDILHDGARRIRRITNNLYIDTNRIRNIQDFKREMILDNEICEKLKVAIGSQALNPIPESVWNYDRLPSLLFIMDKLAGHELEQTMVQARNNGFFSK